MPLMLHNARPANLYLSAFVLALGLSFGAPFRAAELHAQVFLDNLGEEESDKADDLDHLDEPNGEDEGPPDEMLRPDAKQNSENGPPPHSAEENKQNKLDLDMGEAGLAKPLERPKLLAHLYEQLSVTKDEAAAKPIMEAIEDLWVTSGSDTADLLLGRAESLLKQKDVDLSLKILNALVEIAPDNTEAWHQRAKVHFLRQDYTHALGDLRKALAIDPKHYRAINNLGLVLEEFGAKKEALEAYRKALQVNPFLEETRKAVESLAREVEGQDI
jgi:tetratricopeptide (TPR) repeat protein